MNLRIALCNLDPDHADDWTLDGLPRLDAIAERTGTKPTRAEIVAVAPTLTRDTAPEVQAELAAGVQPARTADDPTPEPYQQTPPPASTVPVGEAPPEVAAAPPTPPTQPTQPTRQMGAHANVTDEDLSIQANREAGGHNPTGHIHANAAPEADAIDFAILDAPIHEVVNDVNLLRAAIDAMSAKQLQSVQARKAAQDDLDQWNAKLEQAKRQLVNLERSDPSARKAQRDTAHIRRYLDRVKQTNMQRAGRRAAFLDAGVTPEEIHTSEELAGVPANRPRPRQRRA